MEGWTFDPQASTPKHLTTNSPRFRQLAVSKEISLVAIGRACMITRTAGHSVFFTKLWILWVENLQNKIKSLKHKMFFGTSKSIRKIRENFNSPTMLIPKIKMAMWRWSKCWWFFRLCNVHLGGGFKHSLFFIPIWGKWSNLTSIFFRWVGSTTN